MFNQGKNFIRIILIGANLIILGFLLSILMVVRVIEPSFLLLFISCALSTAGLAIGVILYTSLLARRAEKTMENKDKS